MFDHAENYESDLEWMLRSTQTMPDMIVDYIINAQYPSILRRCLALVGDPAQAEQAALETVVLAVEKRHEYREKASAQAWLASLTLQSCRKQLRRPQGWPFSGRREDLIAGQAEPSPRSLTPDQLRLQRVLNALKVTDLELLLLSSLFELSDDDLADLLHSELEETRQRLEGIRRKIRAAMLAEVSANDEIGAALADLWPEVALEPGAPGRLVDYVLRRLEQRQSRRVVTRFLQQAATVLGILVVAAGIFWISNRLSEQRTPNPFVAQTVIVTRLVYITPTPTQAVTPVALALESTDLEVRDRLLNSRSYWQELWAEAVIYDYGPPGYVGPPSVKREQIWAIQPDYVVVLSGEVGQNAEFAYQQEGGVRYARPLPAGPLQRLEQRQLGEVSNLARLLKPELWFDESADIELQNSDQIAEAAVLWISYTGDDGLAYRVALDEISGVALAMQQYDPRTQTIFQEVIVSRIAYEPRPALPVFDAGMVPTNFVRDYSGLPLLPEEIATLPALNSARPRSALEQVLPEEPLDLSQSLLTFQWRTPGEGDDDSAPDIVPKEQDEDDLLRLVPVEIFADGYFLGSSMLGNPWSLICQRSPDGSKLAILELPEPQSLPWTRLRWLDLTQSLDHEIILNDLFSEGSTYGIDFAFSPDGRYLAFWGCQPQGECGVYLADLAAASQRLLLKIDYASSFRWSPDGQDLAYARWDENLFVIGIDTGIIRYIGNLRRTTQAGQLAALYSWAAVPAVQRADLESCRLPPSAP